MKYRIRVDLVFDKPKDGAAFFSVIKNSQNLFQSVINLADETSYIELEECHHDESPPQPCKILQHIEK